MTKVKYIILLILLALLIIFALQNTKIVEVQLFFWLISMSRALMVIGVCILGFFGGWLARIFYETRSKE